MVRFILSLALLAFLFAPGARAQATADQLNKLSLEALTAPAPPGSGGGGYGSARHSYVRSYAPHSYSHAYAPRSYAHAYARHSYTRRAYARSTWHAHRSYAAAPHRAWAPHRSYAMSRWGHPVAQRHFVAHWTRAPQVHRASAHRVSRYTPKFYRHR